MMTLRSNSRARSVAAVTLLVASLTVLGNVAPRSVRAVAGAPAANDSAPQGPDGPEWLPLDPEYTLYVEVAAGRIVIALSPDFAPVHVRHLRALARSRHFDTSAFFYRVIEGFLAQGGRADGDGLLPEERALAAEFDRPLATDDSFVALGDVDEFGEQAGFINGFPVRYDADEGRVWITHCPRVFGFARGTDPDSGVAHFWIALQSHRPNDRNDTVFGQVVWGMEHVSTMRRTGPDYADDPSTWTPIVSIRVAADLDPDDRTDLEMRNTSSPKFQEYLESRRNPSAEWYQHRPRSFGVCEVGELARLAVPAR
jgi:peptidylprolyl isomerase